ncbi:MAG: response regulator [Chloroflexota bacterium]|jgi:CheY-like chemotaxis protein
MSKILLAEDDRTMVSLLTTLLKMEGYEVVALDVHQDVASAVTQEKPDVLLMDVHLGGQNGMDIVEAIRKDPANGGVNIVMTSGLDMRDECLQRGANHFLLKPFMPDDLLSVLKN